MQKLKYRLTYYRRCLLLLFGLCPKCLSFVNYTTHARPICPKCGR